MNSIRSVPQRAILIVALLSACGGPEPASAVAEDPLLTRGDFGVPIATTDDDGQGTTVGDDETRSFDEGFHQPGAAPHNAGDGMPYFPTPVELRHLCAIGLLPRGVNRHIGNLNLGPNWTGGMHWATGDITVSGGTPSQRVYLRSDANVRFTGAALDALRQNRAIDVKIIAKRDVFISGVALTGGKAVDRPLVRGAGGRFLIGQGGIRGGNVTIIARNVYLTRARVRAQDGGDGGGAWNAGGAVSIVRGGSGGYGGHLRICVENELSIDSSRVEGTKGGEGGLASVVATQTADAQGGWSGNSGVVRIVGFGPRPCTIEITNGGAIAIGGENRAADGGSGYATGAGPGAAATAQGGRAGAAGWLFRHNCQTTGGAGRLLGPGAVVGVPGGRGGLAVADGGQGNANQASGNARATGGKGGRASNVGRRVGKGGDAHAETKPVGFPFVLPSAQGGASGSGQRGEDKVGVCRTSPCKVSAKGGG